MCEYVKIRENDMYICEHTNALCTLCVLGNGNTYKEAQKKQKEVKSNKESDNGT